MSEDLNVIVVRGVLKGIAYKSSLVLLRFQTFVVEELAYCLAGPAVRHAVRLVFALGNKEGIVISAGSSRTTDAPGACWRSRQRIVSGRMIHSRHSVHSFFVVVQAPGFRN